MKLAICQIASTEDKASNFDQITAVIEEAAQSGASLAVLPEFAMAASQTMSPEFIAAAEPLDGEFVKGLTALATKHRITIVAGMHEVKSGDVRVFNTAVVVAPDQGLVNFYHKQYLYDAFGFKESDYVCPGELNKPAVFEIDGVRVGILTCYDLRFPEAARTFVDENVDVLVYPAAWVAGPRKEDHWQTLLRARAIENTFYVAGVSQAPGSGTGGSLIVDPMGLVLGELGERNGVAVAEIRPERITEVRKVNPSLANRRK